MQASAIGVQCQRYRRIDLHRQAQPLLRGHAAKRGFQVSEQIAQVQRLQLELHVAGFDLGQIQHIVDQLQQLVPGPMDDVGMPDLFVVEVAGAVLSQLIAEDQDAVERRTQLVGHVGEEFRLVAVGHRELIGLFAQPPLGSLAMADIDDHRLYQLFVAAAQGRQTDLHRQRAAVTVKTEQLAVAAHPSRLGMFRIALPQPSVRIAQRLRQQQLDRLAEQFLARVTEQQLGLPIDHHDAALRVDQDEGIGRGFHDVAEALVVPLAGLQIEQVDDVIQRIVVAEAGQADGHRNRRAIFALRLQLKLSGVAQLPEDLLPEHTWHIAADPFAGKQIGRPAQQLPGALVGQFDAPARVAQQRRHRQLLDQLAEPRFALLQLQAERLTAAQRPLAQVQIAAHQQGEQHRGGQRRGEVERPVVITQHRLVFRRARHLQLPAAAIHVDVADALELGIGADLGTPRQQRRIGAGCIEQLQLQHPAARTQDAFHQVGQAKSAMQGADERALTLVFGGHRGSLRIEREEQQHARLHVLVGFLLEPQRAGKHRVATVAGADDGLATGRFAEQVETEHASIAPVGRVDVVGHHVLVALTRRVHAETLAAGGANLRDQVRQGLRRRMAGQRNRLDTGIEVLQLQLVRGTGPVVGLDLVAASHNASQPT